MHSKPVRIAISEEQASDFLGTIRDALNRMSKTEIEDVRLIVRKRGAIAISFDKNKRPFLGFSAGFTPPSDRVMLSNDNWLINKCKFWFIARRKSLMVADFLSNLIVRLHNLKVNRKLCFASGIGPERMLWKRTLDLL